MLSEIKYISVSLKSARPGLGPSRLIRTFLNDPCCTLVTVNWYFSLGKCKQHQPNVTQSHVDATVACELLERR